MSMIQEGSYYGGTLYYNTQGVASAVSQNLPNVNGKPQQMEEPALLRISNLNKVSSLMDQVAGLTEHHDQDLNANGESAHGGSLYLHKFQSQMDPSQGQAGNSLLFPASMANANGTAPAPVDPSSDPLKRTMVTDMMSTYDPSPVDESKVTARRSGGEKEDLCVEVGNRHLRGHCSGLFSHTQVGTITKHQCTAVAFACGCVSSMTQSWELYCLYM